MQRGDVGPLFLPQDKVFDNLWMRSPGYKHMVVVIRPPTGRGALSTSGEVLSTSGEVNRGVCRLATDTSTDWKGNATVG